MEYTLNNAITTSNLEPAALKMENKILPIDSHFAKTNEKIVGLWSHLVLLSNHYVAELNIKPFPKIFLYPLPKYLPERNFQSFNWKLLPESGDTSRDENIIWGT